MNNAAAGTNNIDELFLTANRGEVYARVIEHIEKDVIEKALVFSSGNKILAAKILGINRNTLHSKIKKLKINIERFKL